MLETLTMERIMSIKLKPCDCYNPVEKGYMDSNWKGTIVDFLKIEKIPPGDRLWVACHGGFIDNKTLRLFAVWCAREALKTIKNPDSRSVKACDVAEAYAHGKTTEKELRKAQNAAWDVYRIDNTVYSVTSNAAFCTTYREANKAAYWTADWAADWAALQEANEVVNKVEEQRKQVEKLIDMVERKEPK